MLGMPYVQASRRRIAGIGKASERASDSAAFRVRKRIFDVLRFGTPIKSELLVFVVFQC